MDSRRKHSHAHIEINLAVLPTTHILYANTCILSTKKSSLLAVVISYHRSTFKKRKAQSKLNSHIALQADVSQRIPFLIIIIRNNLRFVNEFL